MNGAGSHAPEEVSLTSALTARSRSDHRGWREARVGWQASPHHRPCVTVLGLCSPLESIFSYRCLTRKKEKERITTEAELALNASDGNSA